MKTTTSIAADTARALHIPQAWFLNGICVFFLLFIPNIMIALELTPPPTAEEQAQYWWSVTGQPLPSTGVAYLLWLGLNLVLIALVHGIQRYLLQPLQRIAHHIHSVRAAYAHTDLAPSGTQPMSLQTLARDVGRFTSFAVEYYRKHQEVSEQLEQARAIIAQFTIQQDVVLANTGREISTQYRSVLAYANYLEEQILSNKLDPTLRYDFDDVCESSFNLKLIAGALSMLSNPSGAPHVDVSLAGLMQQTMLALAPALDRRAMKLTTAEVDLAVAAHGEPQTIAHTLWMMLLGMIRYAADESTLRMRCLYNHERTEALLSIVVTELSPLNLSPEERNNHLMRQLQHLTPHMFAETIRIHGNVQLANLLMERMGGKIRVLPLTISSCEICMTLPAATLDKSFG